VKSTPKGPLTDGARRLLAWLDEHGISIPDFCEAHGLPRIVTQRALNGQRRRFTVDFACMVETATGGSIKCEEWSTTTLADQPLAGSAKLQDKKKHRRSPLRRSPARTQAPPSSSKATPRPKRAAA
jgi:hypothetical protein